MENMYENNVHELYPGGIDAGNRIDTVRERPGFGEMFERLSTDMTNLWSGQSRLIGTELNEKVTTVKAASVSLVVGGVISFIGVICLAATAIIALANIMEPWLAAAIVTVALLVIGLVMVKGAQKKLSGKGLVPEHSIDALNQIKNTFQERVHEFKRH
jgi:uncharacterized membrane protein YqjE